MIKTLRITSVLVAMGAIALLGFSVVYGIDKDSEVQNLIKSDGPVARFEQNQGKVAAQKNVNTKHPLVAAAEKFALLLNPPKPTPVVRPTPKLGTNRVPAKAAEGVSSNSELVGICYNAQDPNLSFALIDTPGKGQRWVGLNDKIDHHVVHEIKDGEVILMNGAKFEPLTIQKKATVSLIKGENTGVTKAVPGKAIDATMERGRINSGLRSPLPQRPIGRPGTRNAPLRSTNIMTPEERAKVFEHAVAQVREMQGDTPGMSAEDREREKIRRDKVMAEYLARDRGPLTPDDVKQYRTLGKEFLGLQANSDTNDM